MKREKLLLESAGPTAPGTVVQLGSQQFVLTPKGVYRFRHSAAREVPFNMHLERNERDGKSYPPRETPF